MNEQARMFTKAKNIAFSRARRQILNDGIVEFLWCFLLIRLGYEYCYPDSEILVRAKYSYCKDTRYQREFR